MNNTTNKTVLIIDDCIEIQTLLKTLLAAHGFQVRCAFNGAEGLRQLQSTQQAPDAILLDMRMPMMTGLEFMTKIQEFPNLLKIPLILMSGDQDLEEKGSKTSASVLIKKPLSSPLVLAALAQVLKNTDASV